MGMGEYTYVVCATVYGTDTPSPELSEVMAGQPVVRRLNRIERVALAFDGKLVRRSERSLLITFAAADTAFFSACEMQRRCADLPHPASHPLLLQIGIHRAAPESRLLLPWLPRKVSERRDQTRRVGFETAQRLARITVNNGIVVSGLVLEALPPKVRKIGEPVVLSTDDIAAHAFHWRYVLKCQRAPHTMTGEADASVVSVLLCNENGELRLDQRRPVVTIGRDPGCDLCISNRFASRLHARIEIHGDSCILTDQSNNGTSVVLEHGEERVLRNESVILKGNGRLGFGRSVLGTHDPVTTFSVTDNLVPGKP